MNNNNKSKDKNEFIEEIERIRQSGGGKALLNHEIVAIFLSVVHGKTQAQAIARRLTDKYSGISKIFSQEMDDLKMVEGVTDDTTAIISCVKETLERAPTEEFKEEPVIDDWEKVAKYLSTSIGYSERENLKVMYLNKGYRLVGKETYTGTVDHIPFYITEITRKAVLARATSIIISHNQPGGTVKPSERDKAMTKNLASACATIGIKLADHIIVAGNNYFSFKEKGLL
ncbi:JAB domain-containing protein [Wolbachia endosymbiont of Oedothorax gibbosus]|uniref:JAB domain-containing protein n=1 Tax=Wolbachia endosymbiont of Oedothorax gibbosus TaxID=931100 RepID=UPI0020248451|nr:DNA repair protein RadC [Wolbachia endosymbiont of Oedothorax gibbosus]